MHNLLNRVFTGIRLNFPILRYFTSRSFLRYLAANFILILLSIAIAAQTATYRAPLDFDGDGKTDPAVARIIIDLHERQPLQWWILGSATNQTMPVINFGAFRFPGHIPIPADYDGDGKTDIAVFLRGANGGGDGNQAFFYVLRSSDGQVDYIAWGIDSDDPYLTQDFDGDGKADPTVVRCYIPGNPIEVLPARTWYILESRTNYQTYRVEEFGKCDASRDRPIRGDFDGDRKADLALFRELDVRENGQTTPANRFYIKLSSRRNTVRAVRFDYAQNGAVIEGDFDGDGKTDIASARTEQQGESGYRWWYWIRSSDGRFVAKQFGLNHPNFAQIDLFVPGDYDGDGITDTAVYRTFDLGPDRRAYFHIDGSRDGYRVVQWGLELPDLPIAQYLFSQ
ncbi:MAG: VCBS repeat-containing protein [Pyrinomonadaceae bacterium]|nr:VCBS repeat-containing protein [Pyrinomonadaceae bacterium]